jgi:hypothetical protein
VARGWRNIRDAAQTASFWLLMGLITYLGMSAVVKIEATGIRLFLAVAVFGVAFGAISLLERRLRQGNRPMTSTDIVIACLPS